MNKSYPSLESNKELHLYVLLVLSLIKYGLISFAMTTKKYC